MKDVVHIYVKKDGQVYNSYCDTPDEVQECLTKHNIEQGSIVKAVRWCQTATSSNIYKNYQNGIYFELGFVKM